MRTLLLATTALTMLAAAPLAMAQTLNVAAAMMSVDSVNVDKMIGQTVANAVNEKVGTVERVLIDKAGRARFVVIGVGSFLGLGGREVAVRWSELTITEGGNRILINATKEQLAALPAFQAADMTRKARIYAFDEDLRTNPYLADEAGLSLASKTSATGIFTIDSKKLIGRNVNNSRDEKVGEIDSVLTDRNGNVRYVVVGVGTHLGLGEKYVALPWEALTISKNGSKVLTSVTKAELTAAPEYRYDDPKRRGTSYSFDDVVKLNPFLAQNSTVPAPVPPLEGANSFTESQARDRIEAGGYTAVTGLRKDDQSIWRGKAMKNGAAVDVALDFKGNLVAQ